MKTQGWGGESKNRSKRVRALDHRVKGQGMSRDIQYSFFFFFFLTDFWWFLFACLFGLIYEMKRLLILLFLL